MEVKYPGSFSHASVASNTTRSVSIANCRTLNTMYTKL